MEQNQLAIISRRSGGFWRTCILPLWYQSQKARGYPEAASVTKESEEMQMVERTRVLQQP